MATDKHDFGTTPITCHSFSTDRNNLALSLNDNEVKIFKKQGMKFLETGSLTEHGQRVTGIDWAPKSNRIVTCGADRNAYVWTNEGGEWKPVLVILRINRAATCVKWSPQENKFAVGSAARVISVCYFEIENNWWVSKHIKKPIRSSVTCLDWHPNNVLIAAGSSDFKARVFSTYIKEIEEKPASTNWGNKMPFQSLMAEFTNGGSGWVHAVSFSPSGDKLVWVGHDSSISIADAANGNRLFVLRGSFLPLLDITFVTEKSLVAVGYDCCPKLFSVNASGDINFIQDLDIPDEREQMTKSAMMRFKDLDRKATTDDTNVDLKTQHQNTITHVSIYAGDKSKCIKFSTSGVDGNLIIWDLKGLESSMQGLKIV